MSRRKPMSNIRSTSSRTTTVKSRKIRVRRPPWSRIRPGVPTTISGEPAKRLIWGSIFTPPYTATTRELAEQIKRDLAPLAEVIDRRVTAVYGGVGYGPQKAALRRGVDVLVATPGRLEDLIEQGSVDLSDADLVVVDEADRLADMGFLPAVRRILDRTARIRQTLLFSATLDGDVAVLSRRYQQNPVRHDAGAVEPETSDARHYFWLVDHHDRIGRTADVVGEVGRTIVFTRTRHGATRLSKQLVKLGVAAVAMHGGRTQGQRDKALRAFSDGRVQALVATDVAARGIHVDDVGSVIHFDPPNDHKDYLHRSGRTARAGASGIVVSLVTGDQQQAVRRMQRDLDLPTLIGPPRVDGLHEGGHLIGSGPSGGAERRSGTRPEPARERDAARRPGQGRARRLYVSNLPWSVTAGDLRSLFGGYGEIHGATVVTDRRTGRSRGYGFVDMAEPSARTAIDALHGSALKGRDLTVRFARPKRHR